MPSEAAYQKWLRDGMKPDPPKPPQKQETTKVTDTQSKPTPRPWRIETYATSLEIWPPPGQFPYSRIAVLLFDPSHPGEREQAEANARLIVAAVNAHEALVAALQTAERVLSECQKFYESLDYPNSCFTDAVEEATEMFRAALALVDSPTPAADTEEDKPK